MVLICTCNVAAAIFTGAAQSWSLTSFISFDVKLQSQPECLVWHIKWFVTFFLWLCCHNTHSVIMTHWKESKVQCSWCAPYQKCNFPAGVRWTTQIPYGDCKNIAWLLAFPRSFWFWWWLLRVNAPTMMLEALWFSSILFTHILPSHFQTFSLLWIWQLHDKAAHIQISKKKWMHKIKLWIQINRTWFARLQHKIK